MEESSDGVQRGSLAGRGSASRSGSERAFVELAEICHQGLCGERVLISSGVGTLRLHSAHSRKKRRTRSNHLLLDSPLWRSATKSGAARKPAAQGECSS